MRAFITHGGISSIMEAVNCGVPVIVMPQFGDQFSNAALVEKRGFGVKMLLSEASTEKISENLETVLSDE